MFHLEKEYADEMIAHARLEAPNECCGIMAGSQGKVVKLYRATNSEGSPMRYNIAPKELLAICKEIDEKGWDLLGIYHSHTHSEAYPSSTDVKFALWPDSIYFIVSLKDPRQAAVRAFRINDGKIVEEQLIVQ